jgi:hypothetical protein
MVTDNQHRGALVHGGARHDRVIVREPPVAMDLGEVGEQQARVLEHARPGRVARDLDALPRREVPVEIGPDRLRPAPQALDAGLTLGRGRQHRHRLDFLQQDADRFFELE